MKPNRTIWVEEGNWKVRRETRTWEKQKQCLCTAHRAGSQIPKSCGTGQTGNQPGCVTTGSTSMGTEGADPAFPAMPPCRKLGTFLPSVFPCSVIPEMDPLPCCIPVPVYPSNPIDFPHTCSRRNGKDWKFHHVVVINTHNILLGLISTRCPKRNRNNLPKNSWITGSQEFNPQNFTYSQLPVEPEDTGTTFHNDTFRGNTGNVGVVPIPMSIQDLPDLGISLPHP